MSTKRAALYLRQSKTDDLGIERQRERTRMLAQSREWIIYKEYEDDGVSASKTRSSGTRWDDMLADAKAGLIDVVVAVDLDRLLRSTRDLNVLIDHGLGVVTVNGEIDLTTADGELRASMLASIARFEVRRKGERQSRANVQRAARGGIPKGTRLTGYDTNGKIQKQEAKIVRRIFDEFHRGKALTHIANGLNADAIDTRTGRPWHPSSVRTILLNPRYAGRRVYKGAVVAGPKEASWKPLVTEPIFDAVQARLTDDRRKTNRTGTARKYLGSGLYLCFECKVHVTSNGKRYSCPKCGRIRTMEPIDNVVIESIAQRLRQPDVENLLAKPADPSEAERLDQEIQDARARIIVVERDYDNELIDGVRYQIARTKAEGRLTAALRDRAALAGPDNLVPILSSPDPAQAFLDADFDTKRSIIDACMWVQIRPGKQGQRGFDPDSVVRAWRRTIVGERLSPVVPEAVREALV